MRFFKSCIIFIILIFYAFTPLFAQYFEHSKISGIGVPFFEIVVHHQFDQDQEYNRLMIMAQFLYDDLTFIKSDSSGYDADFELLLAIYDEKDNVVLSRTISKKFNVKDFSLTNSREEKYVLKNVIRVPPGKYILLAKSTDMISHKTTQRKVKLNLPDFRKKDIEISGILFLKEAEFDSTSQMISFVPTIGNNFSTRSGSFYIYFDLYVADTSGPVSVHYTMENKKSGKELDTTIVKAIDNQVTSYLLKIDKDRFKKNKYNLVIEVKSNKNTAKKSQLFSFYWSEVPGTIEDIDLALKQMTFILSSDSLDKYEKASLEEKQAFFKNFWAERDPDPATAKNELKNEYFRRINYANQNFSAFGQDGWVTDRGRILIKFGYPDDIERHPFEMGSKPFEIWRYYSMRKVFLFEDRTGFGDYRLHPAYLDVEFQ